MKKIYFSKSILVGFILGLVAGILLFVYNACGQTVDHWNGMDLSTVDHLNGVDLSTLDHWNGFELPSGTPCTTPDNGDILDEGFIDTGYENTWAETVGTNGTLDEDHSLTGSWPTDACTEGLLASVTTSGGATYTHWNYGSNIAASVDTDVVYYFRVNSYTLPTASDKIFFFMWDSDSTLSNGNRVVFYNNSGTLAIRAEATTNSAAINISTATIYRMIWHLDGTTAADSYIDIDSWSGSAWVDIDQQSFTRATTGGQYNRIGPCYDLDSDEAIEVEVGYTYINTP